MSALRHKHTNVQFQGAFSPIFGIISLPNYVEAIPEQCSCYIVSVVTYFKNSLKTLYACKFAFTWTWRCLVSTRSVLTMNDIHSFLPSNVKCVSRTYNQWGTLLGTGARVMHKTGWNTRLGKAYGLAQVTTILGAPSGACSVAVEIMFKGFDNPEKRLQK